LHGNEFRLVPIPGTTKLHRLEENIGAAEILLSNEEIENINKAIANVEVQGARYPEQLQKMVNR
jgi:aryl-alcohol dehydrogenase-like predicted oxidoreductase